MKIDIERVHELKAELSKINRAELEEIEFYEGGNKVDIDKQTIEEFTFTGLSNVDFITTDFYLGTEI